MATTNAHIAADKPHESKQIVTQAYNSIASWYLEWITGQASPREEFTQLLLDLLRGSQKPTISSAQDDSQRSSSATEPEHSKLKILELGAGAGVPVTQMLINAGVHVLANDISSTQLNLCRERCPSAEFYPGDMTNLTFPASSLDGVASFYAVFHLPRAEQVVMMKRIAEWLKPGGVLVMNLATEDQEEINGEFLGWGMFWSGFAVEGSVKMVEDAGLKVLKSEVREAGDGKLAEDDPDYGVKFLWIVARKEGAVGGAEG
jgi:ubiquinone/menaquinone biosynthesis C-methylase UbiE